MTQLDWVSDHHRRRRDPATSHAAAQSMASAAPTLAMVILATLEAHGPATQSELAQRLALQSQQVNKRTADLKNAGLIVGVGTRPGPCGRQQTVWECTQAGIEVKHERHDRI